MVGQQIESLKGQIAGRLAAGGFAVFPVIPNDKRPLTAHGVKEATQDQGVIRGWWTQWPDANIGIACGDVSDDLVVVDLDVKNANGATSLTNWELINGTLPETYTVSTPSGGMHLYFRLPGNNVRNRVNLLPGVDIRAAGGYVLSAGSDINGREYQATKALSIADGGEVLRRLLAAGAAPQSGPLTMPEQIPEGSRDNWLFKMACSLRDKGLSKAAILSAISAENDAKCVPPMEERELRRIANSAMRYEPKHPFSAPVVIKGLQSLEEIEDLTIRWLWEPYIQRGNLTLLRGDPGVGKTYFVGALMAALAQDEQPRGMPGRLALHNGRSVYFGNEDDPSTLKARVKSAGGGSGIFVYNDPITFKDLQELKNLITEARADLVIFDPIQAYLGASVDMNKANEIRPVLEGLRTLARDTDCAILIIEHLNKNEKQGLLYRGIGSVDILAASRSLLFTVRDPDDSTIRVTFQLKTNTKEGLPVKWSIEDDGVFKWRFIDNRSIDDMEKLKRVRAKTGKTPGVLFAIAVLLRYPQGWKGSTSELIEACPDVQEELDITPKALGHSLSNEDVQFYLKQNCHIIVRKDRSAAVRGYHIYKDMSFFEG